VIVAKETYCLKVDFKVDIPCRFFSVLTGSMDTLLSVCPQGRFFLYGDGN